MRTTNSSAALVAASTTVLLVAFASGYGYHRDELYFLAAGKHLAWAYADQGPLTPLIARAMDEIARDSLTALRLPSALASGATVLITGLLARELGGSRRAELLAASCAAVASIVLFTGHLLSTSTIDLLAWTSLSLVAVRAVRTGEDRLWLAAGVVLGVALLNKPLPAFLALGLLAGVALAGPRRLLRNPYGWSGAAIALLLWSPWILWQADHGWPQLDVSRSVAEGRSTSSEPWWAVVPFQLLLRQSAARARLDRRSREAVPRPRRARVPVSRLGLGGARRGLHGERGEALLPGRVSPSPARCRRRGGGRLDRAGSASGPEGGADRRARRERCGERDHRAARARGRGRRSRDRRQRGRRGDDRLAGARSIRRRSRGAVGGPRTRGDTHLQLRRGRRDRPLRTSPRPTTCLQRSQRVRRLGIAAGPERAGYHGRARSEPARRAAAPVRARRPHPQPGRRRQRRGGRARDGLPRTEARLVAGMAGPAPPWLRAPTIGSEDDARDTSDQGG